MKRSDKVRQAYPSDLTDAQWAVIEPLYSGMRTYKWSKRELTNAVLYFVKMVIPFSQPGPRPENRTVELIK